MGVKKMVLYILAFAIMVGVVFMIERRDSQAGAKSLAETAELRGEVSDLKDKLAKLSDAYGTLVLERERISSVEQALGTMAEKSAEYYRIAEAKIKDVEHLAHSAKMDALRRPQKIEIDMPPIRIVQACAKKKKKLEAAPVTPPAKHVIDDVKKKIKELSQ